MKNFSILFCLLLANVSNIFAQTPITICEQTIKIGAMGEENLFYSFTTGDQILFDFTEINGKELKEIEVVELPSSTKFSTFKATNVDGKKISVNQKAVYQFRFKNGAVSGRICQVKIQRIPESEATARFNTGWKWKTLYDTTYVPYTQDSLVGYDSLWYKETVREEIASRIEEYDLLPGGKPVTVKSTGIAVHDNPRSYVRISLPTNVETPYQTKRVTAWAYWIGVGASAESFFSKNKENLKSAVTGVAGITNPLAGLALGFATDLIIPSGEQIDPVRYAITNQQNMEFFMSGNPYSYYDNGFGKGGSGKFNSKTMCQGSYYICLKNENIHDRIDVTVKAIAIIEVKDYEDVVYDRVKVTPRYVTLNKRRMVVNTRDIRVTIE